MWLSTSNFLSSGLQAFLAAPDSSLVCVWYRRNTSYLKYLFSFSLQDRLFKASSSTFCLNSFLNLEKKKKCPPIFRVSFRSSCKKLPSAICLSSQGFQCSFSLIKNDRIRWLVSEHFPSWEIVAGFIDWGKALVKEVPKKKRHIHKQSVSTGLIGPLNQSARLVIRTTLEVNTALYEQPLVSTSNHRELLYAIAESIVFTWLQLQIILIVLLLRWVQIILSWIQTPTSRKTGTGKQKSVHSIRWFLENLLRFWISYRIISPNPLKQISEARGGREELWAHTVLLSESRVLPFQHKSVWLSEPRQLNNTLPRFVLWDTSTCSKSNPSFHYWLVTAKIGERDSMQDFWMEFTRRINIENVLNIKSDGTTIKNRLFEK